MSLCVYSQVEFNAIYVSVVFAVRSLNRGSGMRALVLRKRRILKAVGSPQNGSKKHLAEYYTHTHTPSGFTMSRQTVQVKPVEGLWVVGHAPLQPLILS